MYSRQARLSRDITRSPVQADRMREVRRGGASRGSEEEEEEEEEEGEESASLLGSKRVSQ